MSHHAARLFAQSETLHSSWCSAGVIVSAAAMVAGPQTQPFGVVLMLFYLVVLLSRAIYPVEPGNEVCAHVL
eukprot:3211045-Pleurochrysis_carterae.AAC.1